MSEGRNKCFKGNGCQYVDDVRGSAHKCCKHPSFEKVMDDPFLQMMSIFASVNRAPPIQARGKITVVGDPTGIKKGWFNHPFSFDPVWILKCEGYKENE